jgi:hypothetical protein
VQSRGDPHNLDQTDELIGYLAQISVHDSDSVATGTSCSATFMPRSFLAGAICQVSCRSLGHTERSWRHPSIRAVLRVVCGAAVLIVLRFFIAQHVSEPRRAAIQHAAWQLLATRTQRRVLVAYYEARSDIRDRAAVESAVRDVCNDNPGKNAPHDIIVITADANARPASAQELREIFSHLIVGRLE